MASILQMLTSSIEAGKNAASSVANHAKASNAKEQDASLFSIVMGGCVPSKSKPKPQLRDVPQSSDRSSSADAKAGVSKADTADAGDQPSANTDGATGASDKDSHSSSDQQPQDAHTEAAEQLLEHQDAASDSLRDGDIVDVPEGYAEEIADPTKDPLNEAIALGLLAGQAVPVNQLPQAAGSFAVAVDAALAAPVNAKNLPLIAPQLLPSNEAVLPEVAVPVPPAAPAPVADAALTALVTASLMDQVEQPSAALPQVPATGEGAMILPKDVVDNAPQDEVAITQALDALIQQAAPVKGEAVVQPPIPQAAPMVEKVVANASEGVKAVSVPSEALVEDVVKTDDEATEDAKPANIDTNAVAPTPAPKRLGKVAPAALKALVEQMESDAQPKQSAESHAKKPVEPDVKEHMAALGSNPAVTARVQAEPTKVVTPVAAIEVAGVSAQTNTQGQVPGDGASGIASVGGSGFAATLQNAVQLPGSQSVVRGGVAEQIAAQIATLPKHKGTQFTLKLNPEEMGAVDVVMEFHKDGHVQLTIRADSKEALAALQRDAQALEQNLQDLGLKTDSGSLQFSLRQDQQGGQAASQFGDAQQQGRGQSGQAFGGRGAGQDEDDALPLAQVNYRIVRADGSVDIEV